MELPPRSWTAAELARPKHSVRFVSVAASDWNGCLAASHLTESLIQECARAAITVTNCCACVIGMLPCAHLCSPLQFPDLRQTIEVFVGKFVGKRLRSAMLCQSGRP